MLVPPPPPPPPPPVEAGAESGAKKPWSKPKVKKVEFRKKLRIVATTPQPGVQDINEGGPAIANYDYDPNIS